VCLGARGGVGPYTWSLINGTLPDGFTLDGVSGSIYGVPSFEGISQFTVGAQDSSLSTAEQFLSLTIGAIAASVPAMSEWGLAAMILLLLTAGTLVCVRRAAAQRPAPSIRVGLLFSASMGVA
jgi:hypothetical protein